MAGDRVDEALRALAADLVARLGPGLVGCYAVPGAARFLVVTADRLHGDAEASVREAHRGIAGPPVLDGGYAPAADLRSPMTVGRAWLAVAPGSRELLPTAQGNTVHDRWLLRHRGRAVTGPPARSLVHDVGPESLRAEALGTARARAEEIEEHPELLQDPAFARGLVTTLCQVLHTAHQATVESPSNARAWAVDHLPAEQRELLDATADLGAAKVRALTWEVHRLVGAEVLRHA
jgi:hypothetical protein